MQYDRNQFDDALLDDPVADTIDEPVDDLIDPIDPIEPIDDSTPEPEEEPKNNSTEGDELDVLGEFLKEFGGIQDGKTIVMEDDETGELTDVDFSSLTKEEQMNIIRSLTDPGLTEDEVKTINYLRSNRVTMQDVIEHYQNLAVQKYIEENSSEKVYSIDDYTDEDLFVADIKARYTDMTDEEIAAELEHAKSNEETFAKKVAVIRQHYKDLEDAKAQEQMESAQKAQEVYQTELKSHLQNFKQISLDYRDPKSDYMMLDDDDHQEIFDYLFKRNANGQTKFMEDLNNPARAIEIGFLALRGADLISDISQHWKSEMKSLRKELSKKPEAPKTTTTTTVLPKKEPGKATSLSSAWDNYI